MAAPLIPLETPRTPPRRFRIWRAGSNPGDYGDMNVTAAAVKRVMGEYEKRGTLLAIDVEHALNPEHNPDLDPNDPPPIAGHAALRVVDTADGPELWADPVRWSDCGRPFPAPGKVCCGKHQIASGQRAYISPDWLFDPATREPTTINRLGLVAEPGTYGINLLAARAAAPRRATKMNDTEILKALLAAAAGAASSGDPDIKAFGEAIGGQCQELAASKGLDLSQTAPASEAAPAQAPEMAGMDEKKLEETVAKAVAKALAGKVQTPVPSTAVASKVSAADVALMVREESERARLLDANKDVLGADVINLLAGKPLAEVKTVVAAIASKASKGQGGDPLRAPQLGTPEGKSYSLAERYSGKGK